MAAAIVCVFATPEQQQALNIVISRIVKVGVMPVGCFGLIFELVRRVQQQDDFFMFAEILDEWQAASQAVVATCAACCGRTLDCLCCRARTVSIRVVPEHAGDLIVPAADVGTG